MRIKSIKFSNAVKIGGSEELFADERKYKIEAVKEPYVRVSLKHQNVWVYTSFYNVVSFEPYAGELLSEETKEVAQIDAKPTIEIEPRRSPGRPRRNIEAQSDNS
jgi:hypothetical protein